MALVDWSTADLDILREVVRAYRSGALFNQGRHSSRRQLAAIQEVGIGVTAEAIPSDGTAGDVAKWTVTDDEFEAIDPTETIEAHDFTEAGVGSGARVLLLRMAHAEGTRWLTIPASGLSIGKYDSSCAKDASGTFSVWSGTPGSETDTTNNITVYNRTPYTIAASIWCKAALINGNWYAFDPQLKARWIHFTLPSALLNTQSSKASCTVNDHWGGVSPGATVTVFNPAASSNNIFSGASGAKGLAVYDDIDDKYWLVQLQC